MRVHYIIMTSYFLPVTKCGCAFLHVCAVMHNCAPKHFNLMPHVQMRIQGYLFRKVSYVSWKILLVMFDLTFSIECQGKGHATPICA